MVRATRRCHRSAERSRARSDVCGNGARSESRRDFARYWPRYYQSAMRQRSGCTRKRYCMDEDRSGHEGAWTARHRSRLVYNCACEAKLNDARSVAEILIIEAKAASVYWRSYRDLGLIECKGGNLPRSWMRFANRGKGAEFLGNKHASHPISAMINYCIVIEAGRLARALASLGLALQIGFLHSDKHGRNSLVWDCIEPLRASINARVFAFIASREFSRSDFPASGVDVRRIARPVIGEMLAKCLLPDRDILDVATWLRDRIMRHGATNAETARRAFKDTRQRTLQAVQ
jgi:hypothetical protein